MKDSFVHLHVHSEYSLLESSARIHSLVERAAELGMESLAITDSCAMYGILPFYHACRAKGIQPILGMELFLSGEEKSSGDTDTYKLILLAENEGGYRNLIKLVSRARLSGKIKPSIPKSVFKNHPSLTDGVIALSPMLESEMAHYLQKGNMAEAENQIREYASIFPHSFFLEICDHGLLEEKELFEPIIHLGKKYEIPLVATNQVHYVKEEDVAIYDVLNAIGKGLTFQDPQELLQRKGEFYLKRPGEMKDLFIFLPEAIENTRKIASRCKVELSLGQTILPSFPLPDPWKAPDYLRYLCEKGMAKRYGDEIPPPVWRRLEYELNIINRMGFEEYFLIVWDFVRYARQQGIAVGPGRGSAAGSLVAYVLQITDIDPIKYKLLFERFLNPERITMPDIDIDFSFDRRDEVIQYVVEKYGRDRVAQIITFGTMGARAAIRDVGRVLGLSVSTVDRIAKLIPQELGVTLDKAREKNKKLDNVMEENPGLEILWIIARAIEGMPRHTSIHAAGVVISRDSLTEYVPLQEGHEGHALTQYTMEGLEEVGLLKMDFLALRNLTIIEQCVEAISLRLGRPFKIDDIPLNDPDTYGMLMNAETTGVFQLESVGMRNVLRQVQPENFEEIIAVLALFRPGPMEFIPGYAKAKKNLEKVKYLHPKLEPILKDTYGYILYQEQIMQIASVFAGFSLGEADILRRAVSKKKKEILQEQREKFVAGCLAQGYRGDLANQIYDWIVRFADYGFNRSHSAAYALIAYQTAYLKSKYPVYFLASLLKMVTGNMDKVREYIEECKRLSIPIFPPDLNLSSHLFTVENDGIRFGLSAIKNVGGHAIKHILEVRQKGPFIDLYDFCRRIDLKICNRRVLESLILSGCMDPFPGHRAAFLAILDDVMEWGTRNSEYKKDNQLMLFGEGLPSHHPPLPENLPPYQIKEKLEQEKEMLGLYLSGHPLDEYQSVFQNPKFIAVAKLHEFNEGATITFAGIVAGLKMITTKKGDPMAFLEIEDPTGIVEVTVFPGVYGTYSHLLKKENLLIIKGRMNRQDHRIHVIANSISGTLSEIEQQGNVVFIKIGENIENKQKELNELKTHLLHWPGNVPVILYYESSRKTLSLSEEYFVEYSDLFRKEIEKIVGIGGIVLKQIPKKLL